MKSLFITATDTEVGKTTIASGIIRQFAKLNYKTVGFKPIAAGCELNNGQWQNEDALALIQASNHHVDYAQVNPFALKSPIAPHIAAEQESVEINFLKLTEYFEQLKQTEPDLIVVEGAGGWQLPINQSQYLSEWVVEQKLPIVLVIGLKLGCINHALLTAMAIEQMGGKLVAWVGNHVDPNMLCQQENIKALEQRLNLPCLGIVPYLKNNQSADSYLNTHILNMN